MSNPTFDDGGLDGGAGTPDLIGDRKTDKMTVRASSELFERVVELIKTKFIPIVEKHSISGLAYINSEDPVFEEPLAIAMLIDVFTERGFTAVVDIRKMEVPSRIDPKSYEIINRSKKVYRVRINFPGSKIRRGL